MNRSEVHIFIIWSKACFLKEKIISDLQSQFQILDIFKVTWDKKYFSNNLTRFYGEYLPRFSGKERLCGKGPFVTVIVRDKQPIYEYRITNRGKEQVNKNIFDLKCKYRHWTGGGHKIHGTNNGSI